MTRLRLFTLLIALIPAVAPAQGRPAAPPPQSVSGALRRFAEQNRMPCAMHGGKLYIKVDTTVLQRNWESYCRIGDGKVIEFNGRSHLFTRFNGGKCVDFLETLDLSTFSPPTQPRVTAIVRLTDPEHRELNAYVDAAQLNSAGVVGTFNYGGGRPKRYYPGSTTANCTSWISTAKLDGKQSLAAACGVWESGSPGAWIQSLVRRGNERVEAVLLHQFQGDVGSWQQVDRFITESMAKH